MALIEIPSPDDEELYPLKVQEVLVRNGQIVRLGETLVVCEATGGNLELVTATEEGRVQDLPTSGDILPIPMVIAQIDTDYDPEITGPRASFGDATTWRTDLTDAQVELVDIAYHRRFGSKCDGDPVLHPADRAVQADVSFAEIARFEKDALERTIAGTGDAEDIAVWASACARERDRRDGYTVKYICNQNGGRTPVFVQAFICPVIESLEAASKLPTWAMPLLDQAVSARAQCFEDTWDLTLPEMQDLREAVDAFPPDFASLETSHKRAAAFGRVELERVLTEGFSATGRPSGVIWSTYEPMLKQKRSVLPLARAVDQHPIAFLLEQGKEISTRDHEALLGDQSSRLRKETAGSELLNHLQAATERAPEGYRQPVKGAGSASGFWSRLVSRFTGNNG